jgi:acyl carrier protein
MSAPIPKGVELLVHKAAVDPAFKTVLMERRAAAAREIGLELDAAETAMLAAVPAAQLETIIARTSVPEEHRRAFLGKAAAAMLAALGAMSGGVAAGFQLQGVRPDAPPAPTGIRPDKPVEKPEPQPTRGIRPDRPPPKEPTLEECVIAAVRTQWKVPKEQAVTRDTKLVKGLKADAAGIAALRKEIDKQCAVEIPAEAYKKIESVGQLIDTVAKALKDKKESKPPEKKPLPPEQVPSAGVRSGPVTFGVRPRTD